MLTMHRDEIKVPDGVDVKEIVRKDNGVIVTTICNVLSINPDDLVCKTRKRGIVDARHLIGYVLSFKKELTLKSICALTGHRSHASIYHSVTVIEGWIDIDRNFRRDLVVLFDVLSEN